MDEKQKSIQFPINKLSYSGLTQLLRNPLIFKLKYILGVYDGKVSVSGMVGRAGHEALKVYYGGNIEVPVPMDKNEARAIAYDFGLNYLDNYSDIYIEYGKTGSREGMLKTYAQAMDFYFAEEPEYNDILIVEEKLQGELKSVDGDILPLPAVGVPDIVDRRKDGGVDIVDIKFVKSFTSYETEDYIKIIQSQFLWHLLRTAKEITADRMIFREVKVTKNSKEDEGKPQVRDWVIPFSHEQYRIVFYNLYKDVVRFLSNPDVIYLPNLSDNFDGEQAGLLYSQSLLNSDMSDVEVMHKVKDLAFVSKKFVPSRLDQIENKHLDPEERIKIKLAEFGIPVEPIDKKVGTNVTQYRFKVSRGVRMSTFAKHKADIALSIEAKGDIRIQAPIPGTELVGIEVPNENRTTVQLGKEHFVPGTLSLPIGLDVNGDVVKTSLTDMPHLLIAGATGSGKSILLHSLITAITEQMKPENLDLVLIDPKRVELIKFAKLPHLHGQKVVFEYEDAVKKLMSVTDEMDRRYKLLEKHAVRDVAELNKKYTGTKKKGETADVLDYIVVVIDEFADFMLRGKMEEKRNRTVNYENKSPEWIKRELERRLIHVIDPRRGGQKLTKARIIETLQDNDAKNEMKRPDANIELLMVRLAQLGRAAGIHVILATQRPSVDVITGLIKANFPTRIALTTASGVDSKVILGEEGAEKLSGKGDMLFVHPGNKGRVRLQGFMI